MNACPMPHSSAQAIVKRPVLFGVTRNRVSIPGTASIFIRHAGTQKSCSTSRAWTRKCTGTPCST